MTANRIFWLMLLAVAIYIGACQLAEYVGSAMGSVWIAGAIGVFAGLIAQFTFRPFVKRAQDGGYFENSRPKSVPAIIGQAIVFTIVTAIYILARSQVSIDYTTLYVVGFWAVIFVIWLATAAKSRKLDHSR